MTAIAHAFADALTQAAASKGRLEVRHTERKDVSADLVELVLQDHAKLEQVIAMLNQHEGRLVTVENGVTALLHPMLQKAG